MADGLKKRLEMEVMWLILDQVARYGDIRNKLA
jgi:hypothetical protein